MINVETETMIPLSAATQHLPGNPSESTVRRWVEGFRGCRLEILRVGGRVFTSVEACQRFVASQNEPQSN